MIAVVVVAGVVTAVGPAETWLLGTGRTERTQHHGAAHEPKQATTTNKATHDEPPRESKWAIIAASPNSGKTVATTIPSEA